MGAMQNVSVLQDRGVLVNVSPVHRLTERQKDCLRLVAQGYTSKEIGRMLDLSPSTVDNHILAATQLLEAPSRAVAARMLHSSDARQKLPSQPQPLADPMLSGVLPSPAVGAFWVELGRRIFSLPPIGGQRNDLDSAERTLRIVQVAAVSFGTVMSLALLIAGAFRLFS
jgi:DNA-binding CsgD family transcriptional regulator